MLGALDAAMVALVGSGGRIKARKADVTFRAFAAPGLPCRCWRAADAAAADATPRGQLYHNGGRFVKGEFPGAFGRGAFPVCLGVLSGVGVLRLYARAAVPGGPFPAAADVTPRPLPRMGKGGGMG